MSLECLRAAKRLAGEQYLQNMTEQNKQTVAEMVRHYLEGRRPGGAILEVLEPEIRKEEYWWQVPVRPSVEPTKRYEYHETLADVEAELDENEQLKVLLVPYPSEE